MNNPSQSQPCGVGPSDHTGQQGSETSGKHTPGPWTSGWVEVRGSHVEPFSGFLVWPAHQTSITALMDMAAITSPWAYGEDDEIGEANARLIAAAPDFLASAKDLIEAWDARTTGAQQIVTGKSDRDLQKQAMDAIEGLRAAIAKASAQ